jgi:hypothetical protein
MLLTSTHIAPASKPVPVPNGTIGTTFSLHRFAIRDTCSVFRGNTTTSGKTGLHMNTATLISQSNSFGGYFKQGFLKLYVPRIVECFTHDIISLISVTSLERHFFLCLMPVNFGVRGNKYTTLMHTAR